MAADNTVDPDRYTNRLGLYCASVIKTV
ncbi:uncharacterized protein METZ01_LOCUS49336 [marine metagenome]|uniref:Uncharacterized protein n=1 Tax=marine metagenome TaxID=408172 RepID=A0A381RXB9_9ZZZZ